MLLEPHPASRPPASCLHRDFFSVRGLSSSTIPHPPRSSYYNTDPCLTRTWYGLGCVATGATLVPGRRLEVHDVVVVVVVVVVVAVVVVAVAVVVIVVVVY